MRNYQYIQFKTKNMVDRSYKKTVAEEKRNKIVRCLAQLTGASYTAVWTKAAEKISVFDLRRWILLSARTFERVHVTQKPRLNPSSFREPTATNHYYS